jgi:hypothetical protein
MAAPAYASGQRGTNGITAADRPSRPWTLSPAQAAGPVETGAAAAVRTGAGVDEAAANGSANRPGNKAREQGPVTRPGDKAGAAREASPKAVG